MRGKGNDNGILESFDFNNLVKNLHDSQSYQQMYFFAAHTCNPKTYFGVKNVNNWIDTDGWEKLILCSTN